nr:hypothetical protein [Tanacetum cinerariifolium]
HGKLQQSLCFFSNSPRSITIQSELHATPMPNPDDITNSTTAMNMALALMAKAFKLNYSTPTNNNQRISSNPRNRQIAQPGMNMGQDRQMQMVGVNGGNQFRQYAGQNAWNPAGYNDVIGNQVIQNAVQNPRVQNVRNPNGLMGVQRNCNLVAVQEYDLMAAEADLDEIEEVNANCILMANLQQASPWVLRLTALPSMIQTDQLRQIAQPGMNMGQDRQMQMFGGNGGTQFR